MRSKYLWIVLSVAVATVAVVVGVYAGNPDGPPGLPESTHSYTLEDIYRRLDTGAAGTPITFTEPISGPGTGTMHTLDEIIGVAPAVDETNGATQAQVLVGRTVWGLTGGGWGAMTGTMPDNGAVVYTPGTITQAIAMGYHDGSGYVVGDTDLVSGNVRGGVSLFGVSGDPNVVDTSSGDAVSGEILTGTAAWVDGVEMTGTMTDNGAVTMVPTMVSQTVALGYHNGSGKVEGDADLVAGNIKSGVSIFGVDGTHVGGPAYPGQVPKTGQTVSYVTGDDGDLEEGLAWPSPRFITSTTGIVTDALTGLVWLQDADCLGTRTWAEALTQIGNLNSGTDFSCDNYTAGTFGDWRLPNVRELQSLVDYSQDNPALPSGHPFTGVQSNYYWSSTAYASNTSYAWYVHLRFGYVYAGSKSTTISVWPVRGGQ